MYVAMSTNVCNADSITVRVIALDAKMGTPLLPIRLKRPWMLQLESAHLRLLRCCWTAGLLLRICHNVPAALPIAHLATIRSRALRRADKA